MGKIVGFILVFLLGFLVATTINHVFSLEKPFSLSALTTFSSGITGNAIAPERILSAGDIEVYPNKIVINVANSSLSRYAATGSMIPTLNENSKGIKIPVTSKNQLHIGDIVTYQDANSNDLIIHRIIGISFDEKGDFYIIKGDNNIVSDGKIRFEQIKYKLVVLVY
ncbi:MAG: hypothetical protein AABW73_02465 [Nanoarchaeota archaeon]